MTGAGHSGSYEPLVIHRAIGAPKMPKGCHGTLTELHEAANLEKMLREEYDLLRFQKRPCLRTVTVLDLCLMRADNIVAQIKREYYGDNSSHYPGEDGRYSTVDRDVDNGAITRCPAQRGVDVDCLVPAVAGLRRRFKAISELSPHSWRRMNTSPEVKERCIERSNQ